MLLAPVRYVRRDARIYDFSSCLLCGCSYGIAQGEPRACWVTTCLACGSPQCKVNGLARGQCGVCGIGLLPPWAGSERACTYKGCACRAIVRVGGRNSYRCRVHLERGKWAGYLARRLAERDKDWVLTGVREVPFL